MNQFITQEDEIKAFSGASVALSPDTLTPYLIQSRAEKELRNILTDSLYDELLVLYTNDTLNAPGNEHAKALLPYVQKPLLLLAIYDFLCEGHATVSDAGIQVANRDRTAFRWQQVELKNSYIEKAYFSLDELIRYLNKNKADFADWESSSSYALDKGHFINDVETFQKWVNIRESYRMLVVLRPSIRNIEESLIKNLLTTTIYEQLKSDILDDDLDADQLKLLEFLEPAVAYRSMADAVETMHIDLTADGGYVKSLAKTEDNSQEVKIAKENQLRSYYDKLLSKGEMWLTKLRKYLNENASSEKYSSYFESDHYEDPDTSAVISDPSRNSFNAMTGPR